MPDDHRMIDTGWIEVWEGGSFIRQMGNTHLGVMPVGGGTALWIIRRAVAHPKVWFESGCGKSVRLAKAAAVRAANRDWKRWLAEPRKE